jgi:hypothetical protein
VPSGYESPRRVPLLNKMFFGDSALSNQASVRRRSASTPPSSVGMQSREDAPTKGGLPEDHRTRATSSIAFQQEKFLSLTTGPPPPRLRRDGLQRSS